MMDMLWVEVCVISKAQSVILGSESHLRVGKANKEARSLLLITTLCPSGKEQSL